MPEHRRQYPHPADALWSVVIAAAGVGARMGGQLRKPYVELAGQPILHRTIGRFLALQACAEIIVVLHPDECAGGPMPGALEAELGVTRVVPGGQVRQQSVMAGLESLGGQYDVVLIHDVARPLVRAQMIERVAAAAAATGAAIAAVRATETVKSVSRSGVIRRTLTRDGLWFARTPQGFRRELILDAHRRAAQQGFTGTDDAQLVERLGEPVAVIEDDCQNIKITTPADLDAAEAILRRRGDAKRG